MLISPASASATPPSRQATSAPTESPKIRPYSASVAGVLPSVAITSRREASSA